MGPDENNPPAEIVPGGRGQRVSPFQRFGLPPPMVRIHTSRKLANNVRKVREISDQHGAMMAVAYGDNGLKTLKKIRYRLPDTYTSSLEVNDPQRTPDRWRRRQHRMLIRRLDGPHPDRTTRPTPPPGSEEDGTPGT